MRHATLTHATHSMCRACQGRMIGARCPRRVRQQHPVNHTFAYCTCQVSQLDGALGPRAAASILCALTRRSWSLP
jgi:hypothetical protein